MKAVIFDMDGVLVDVRDSYRSTIIKVVEHFCGERISNPIIQKYKNQGGLNNDWDLSAQIIKDRGSKVSWDEVRERFQSFYYGDRDEGFASNEKWMVNENILKNLRKLCRTGIVTGRPREDAALALERFMTKNFFSAVVTMDDLPPNRGKPDPLGLEIAMKQLNTDGGFYLGDNVDDIKAGLNAGLTPVGIVWGVDNPEKQEEILGQAGAKSVLYEPEQIFEVLA